MAISTARTPPNVRVFEWYQCMQEGQRKGPLFRYLEGALGQSVALLCASPGVLGVGLPPVTIHGGDRGDVTDDGVLEFIVDAVPLFKVRISHQGKFVVEFEFDPYREPLDGTETY